MFNLILSLYNTMCSLTRLIERNLRPIGGFELKLFNCDDDIFP